MIYIIQLITAFLGSLGFGITFNIRGKKLFCAALGSFFAWGTFLLLGIFTENEPIRYLIASLIVSVYAEIMARIQRTPTTTYLVTSMISLIPGGILYRTMSYAFSRDWKAFFESGIYTLSLAAALAIGIITVTSAVFIFGKIKRDMASRKGLPL